MSSLGECILPAPVSSESALLMGWLRSTSAWPFKQSGSAAGV